MATAARKLTRTVREYEAEAIGEGSLYLNQDHLQGTLQAACEHFGVPPIDAQNLSEMSPAQIVVWTGVLGLRIGESLRIGSLINDQGKLPKRDPSADNGQASSFTLQDVKGFVSTEAPRQRAHLDNKVYQKKLEAAYQGGKRFNEFLEEMLQDWQTPDAIAAAARFNEHAALIHPDRHEHLSPNMIRLWRQPDAYQGRPRAPIEQIDFFSAALELDEPHQRMAWKMLRGKPFAAQDYDVLEQETRTQGNAGILTRGLLDASGLPNTLVSKTTGANRLSDNLRGNKFENEPKAARFVEYVFPAALAPGEPRDNKILTRQRRAAKLLSDPVALPPASLARIKDKQNARTLLDATLRQNGTFQDFLAAVMKEWEITPTDLRELTAYRYQQATGRSGAVWESTLSSWFAAGKETLSPHPEGIVILRMGLGLDESDEMRLWRLIRGREPQNLDALIANAVGTHNTGPLVRELVTASGIPLSEHLEKLIPTTQLYEWMQTPGVKISNTQSARRLLDLVYPAQRFSDEAPDPRIQAQHKLILDAVSYKQEVSEETVQHRKDWAQGEREKARAALDQAVAAHPFADIVEDVARKKQRWDSAISQARAVWDTTPRQWHDWISRHHADGEAVSAHTLWEWEKNPKVREISPHSVATLRAAYELSELQELMIWKAKAGRYLDPRELRTALVQAQKDGNPKAVVELLQESSGIQDVRLRELLGITDMGKWKRGGNIGSPAMARSFVEKTMEVERWLMGEQQRGAFDKLLVPELVQALTGRTASVSQIVSQKPPHAAAFLKALCGPDGIETLSDAQFAGIIGVDGEWQARQIRRGSHLMTSPQQERLLGHFNGTSGAPVAGEAHRILSTKKPARTRAVTKESAED